MQSSSRLFPADMQTKPCFLLWCLDLAVVYSGLQLLNWKLRPVLWFISWIDRFASLTPAGHFTMYAIDFAFQVPSYWQRKPQLEISSSVFAWQLTNFVEAVAGDGIIYSSMTVVRWSAIARQRGAVLCGENRECTEQCRGLVSSSVWWLVQWRRLLLLMCFERYFYVWFWSAIYLLLFILPLVSTTGVWQTTVLKRNFERISNWRSTLWRLTRFRKNNNALLLKWKEQNTVSWRVGESISTRI